MSSMVWTTPPTTWPPCSADWLAVAARLVACCACSAFCTTVPCSCSIVAELCCSRVACSSVRCARSVLLESICAELAAIVSAEVRTCRTICASAVCISASEASTLLWCTPASSVTSFSSPAATRLATARNSAGSAPSARIRLRMMRQASTPAIARARAQAESKAVLVEP